MEKNTVLAAGTTSRRGTRLSSNAHIALTVIALLLERMAEHACADTWRNIRDDLKGIQLAQLIGSNGTLWQVTEPPQSASNRLKSLQISPHQAILKLA